MLIRAKRGIEDEASLSVYVRLAFAFMPLVFVWGCSLLATRPVQEMSDTTAAFRAAKEVQADTLAPDLYRKADDWFLKARHEYKFKNFDLAKEYAEKARALAEQAEFEAIRNGGVREEPVLADPLANVAATPTPYSYPVPQAKMSDPSLNGAPAPRNDPVPAPNLTPQRQSLPNIQTNNPPTMSTQ